MSRSGYVDEEDFSGQFELWQANVERSIRGKVGQSALRRLAVALEAMPEKRLVKGEFTECEILTPDRSKNEMWDAYPGGPPILDGDVCALGALALAEGRDRNWLAEFDPDDQGACISIGHALNVPRLVAMELVWQTDECGPSGIWNEAKQRWISNPETAEECHARVLAWVNGRIKP